MTSSWVAYEVRAGGHPEELVSEALADATASMEICGIEEFADGEGVGWRIYFAPELIPAGLDALLVERLGGYGVVGTVGPAREVQRENWHDNWREYFHAVEVGERLIIVPAWKAGAAKSARIPINIEPGMAFGTGTHATTQLCLEMAELYVKPGAAVLDIGTGTGILSIAAIKLGAAQALGTDLDDDVRENFIENCRINDVTEAQIQLIISGLDEVDGRTFDVIFCNMLSHEFMPLLHLLPAKLRDRRDGSPGTLLLSGFLVTESDEVRTRLEELGLKIVEERKKEEWRAFAAQSLGA